MENVYVFMENEDISNWSQTWTVVHVFESLSIPGNHLHFHMFLLLLKKAHGSHLKGNSYFLEK